MAPTGVGRGEGGRGGGVTTIITIIQASEAQTHAQRHGGCNAAHAARWHGGGAGVGSTDRRERLDVSGA